MTSPWIFVETLPLLALTTDADVNKQLLNQHLAQFVGRDNAQINVGDFASLIHPDDLHIALAQLEITKVERGMLYAEYRVRRADGIYRLVSAFGVPLFCCEIFSGYVITLTDITSRRFTEELDQRLQAMRKFVDSLEAMVWIITDAKSEQYTNRSLKDFLGLTQPIEEEHVWADYLHEDDWEYAHYHWLKAVEQRASFDRDFRLRRHDGAYRWVRSYGHPQYSPDGVFWGMMGTMTDVTAERTIQFAFLRNSLDKVLSNNPAIQTCLDFIPGDPEDDEFVIAWTTSRSISDVCVRLFMTETAATLRAAGLVKSGVELKSFTTPLN